MIYFKKILNLARRALTKMMFLVRERFDMIEVKILSIGLMLCALTGIYFLYLIFTDPSLYNVLSSTAVVHLMGGRALGIARCLSAGISFFYTVLYNFYLEVIIVLVAYGVIVLIMRNVIQPKIFHHAVRQAELTAQSQKTNIKRYGAVGLFLFVMFPFFMTGPVVGAVIGYLLHYKAINNFLIVFSGTLTSIIIYASVGNRIIGFINQYVEIELLKQWGGIVVGILILVFLIYHLKTVKAFLDSEDIEE